MHVWLDGEFYNREELVRALGGDTGPQAAPTDDPALLLALYRQEDDFGRLNTPVTVPWWNGRPLRLTT